ncbi:MAG: hypothetical protein ABIK44_06420 [candidate division WOR-3 bacterium]
MILPAVVIVWGFVGIYLLQLALDTTTKSRGTERILRELAYFPSGRFVRGAAIEYQELASDFVWLAAIDYYGRHQETDRKYQWLGHIFEVLTTLDPHFIGAYHFGAIVMAWDARRPAEALRLLTKGMKANPMNWQIPFDAAFINCMLTGDYPAAAFLFNASAKLPGAWSIASRWAPHMFVKAGDFETARMMWRDIYYSTENRKLRELVIRQLKNLKLEEDLAHLQKAVDRFHEEHQRWPTSLSELKRAGYLESVPSEDPWGGSYYLDQGRVRTTTPPSKRD